MGPRTCPPLLQVLVEKIQVAAGRYNLRQARADSLQESGRVVVRDELDRIFCVCQNEEMP